MKTRILLSTLLFVVLLSGLVLPAMAQGPAQGTAERQPMSPEEQFKRGLITEKEYDVLAPQGPGCCGTEDTGGPDPFGYAFIDSDEPGGPAYSWIDISSTGTNIAFADENRFGPLPIGFSFNFYGLDYTDFWASSNGWISIGATDPGSTYLTNDCPLPSTNSSGNMIGGIWDDLDNDTSTPAGTGYYQSFAAGTCPYPGYAGACLVVEWYNMYHYASSPADNMTFEIVLFDDLSILIQFQDASNEAGSGSTTGIENADETIGLTYACNTAGTLHDALAVRFALFEGPVLSDSTKDAPDYVVTGESIDYTVTILNTGSGPAENAMLVDPIPAGTVYNGDVACSSGTCGFDGTNVWWEGQVAAPEKAAAPPAARAEPAGRRRVELVSEAADGGSLSAGPWEPLAPVPLILDDGSAENNIGVGSGGLGIQFLWLNRFTPDPGDFPFDLQEISVAYCYPDVPVGGAVDLVVYVDPDGDGDPSDATWLATYNGTVQANNCTFSVYALPAPLQISGPGDVLIGVINRYVQSGVTPQEHPAALDQGVSQGRSWLGWWTTDPPVPPALPPDEFFYVMDALGYPGNWLVRASGETVDQPPENPVTITFSVDTDGLECGAVVLNEATITDPGLIGPVVVSADTQLVAGLPLLTEGFDGETFPPSGWTEAIVNDPGTDPDWARVTTGTSPTIAPYAGAAMAKFNSYSAPSGASARLATYALDLSGAAQPVVSLYMSHDTGYSSNADRIQVQVSTDGIDWANVGDQILRYDAAYVTPGWGYHEVGLLAYAGEPVVYVGLLGISGYGNNFYVDAVKVGEGCYVPTPEIDVTPLELNQTLCPDEQELQTLTICNLGDAPLTWELTEIVPERGAEELGDWLFDVDFGGSTADTQLLGGEFALGYYWVTGGNSGADPNKLYKLDTNGALVATYDQPAACTGWGGRDLAFDGTYLYFGCDSGYIYQIDPATGAATGITIPDPTTPARALAYDPATDHFWAANWDSNLYEFDRAGTIVNSFAPVGLSTYGMAWDSWSAGGPFLWLWSQDGPDPLLTASQVNPATGALTGASFLGVGVVGEMAGGAAISDEVVPGQATFLGMIQGVSDRVSVYDLGAAPPPDLPWLAEDPLAGTVDGGACQVVDVTFDSTGLAPGTYTGALEIDSNDADEPTVTVPVALTVEPCGGNTVTCGLIAGQAALDPYGRIVVRWWVEAVDQADAPLADVHVTADMTWPAGGPVTRTRITHMNGVARFYWGYRTSGHWTIDVSDMVLDGYTFVDGANCFAEGDW